MDKWLKCGLVVFSFNALVGHLQKFGRLVALLGIPFVALYSHCCVNALEEKCCN